VSTRAELVADALKYALSSDATSALRFLEEVRAEVQLNAVQAVTVTAATMTAAANNYDVTAAPFSMTSILEMRELLYSDASGYAQPMESAGLDYILARQQSVVQGIPTCYALEGASRVYFDTVLPVGAILTLHWVPTPTALSSDSSVPAEVPPVYHRVYADGAAALLAREDSPELSMALQQRYEMGLDRVRTYANRRKGVRPARIMAGYPGRQNRMRAPHDRSQYPSSY
jgi:hypothetical protein